MTLAPNTRDQHLAALTTEQGRFAMVALDQRESLRAMFPRTESGAYVDDEVLRAFKAVGSRLLSPHASGLLLDRGLGLPSGRPEGFDPNCGLIVAADVLHQETGEALRYSSIDSTITPGFLRQVGASAVKFLVLWHRGHGAEERERLVTEVAGLAREAGVLSLVEGIVRPDDDSTWNSDEERHAAILDAAEEISSYGVDVYKAEVPGYVDGDVSLVREHSERVTEIVGGKWVVLSNGVRQEEFPDALREAVAGGASGFLAGRAVWLNIVGAERQPEAFENLGLPQFERLATIVGASS